MSDDDFPDEFDVEFDHVSDWQLEDRELETYTCPRCQATHSRAIELHSAIVRTCMICSLRWLP